MLQLVSTLDENGQVVAKGTKVQRGYYADNGPPTTLSGNGRDLSLAYQVRPYGNRRTQRRTGPPLLQCLKLTTAC